VLIRRGNLLIAIRKNGIIEVSVRCVQHPTDDAINLILAGQEQRDFTTRKPSLLSPASVNLPEVSILANRNKGPLNNNWRGGRSIASNGYVLILVGIDHPLADIRGYAYEHRLVASKKIGRLLLPGEQVHHINENKRDNCPENLEVVLDLAHHRFHHRAYETGKKKPDEVNPVTSCACGCGNEFNKYDGANRPRKFISGHNPQPAGTMDAILIALTNKPQMTCADLVSVVNKPPTAIKTALSKMVKTDKLIRVGHGIYARKTV
jgi:hypothetical protein